MAKVTEGAFEGRSLPGKYTGFPDDVETRVFHIRLHKERAEALQKIFLSQGQSMSSGIRAILYDWLTRNMR